jgi:hypothetical protein
MRQKRGIGLWAAVLSFLLGLFIGGNVQMVGLVAAVNPAVPRTVGRLLLAPQNQQLSGHFNMASIGLPSALGPMARLLGLTRERPADSNHAITSATTATTPVLQALIVAPNAAAGGGAFVINDLGRMRIAPEASVGGGWSQVESVLDVQAGAKDTIIARFGRDDAGEFQSLAEIRTAKILSTSGNEIGRGSLRLIDSIDNRTMELGYYEFGAGLFTKNLFEFFSSGVSIRTLTGGPSFLAVRDPGDLRDLRLRHDGIQGILETTAATGFSPGGIQMGGNGPNTFLTAFGEVMVMTDEGNIGIGTATEFGVGSGVIGVSEAKAIPTENPVQGGILYVEDGALKYRGPGGTVTTIAKP